MRVDFGETDPVGYNTVMSPECRKVVEAYPSWKSIGDQTQFWVPDGRPPILIREMSTKHLRNTIKFLRRRSFAMMNNEHLSWYAFPMGDMAELAVDSIASEEFEWEMNNPQSWVEAQPVFQAMERELAKREGHGYLPRADMEWVKLLARLDWDKLWEDTIRALNNVKPEVRGSTAAERAMSDSLLDQLFSR